MSKNVLSAGKKMRLGHLVMGIIFDQNADDGKIPFLFLWVQHTFLIILSTPENIF
jgi:hypothetical protein